MKYLLLFTFAIVNTVIQAQTRSISGTVKDKQTAEALAFCNVFIKGTNVGATTDASGYFKLLIPKENERQKLVASFISYKSDSILISTIQSVYNFNLLPDGSGFKDVVISGTLKESSKTESPIPVEVYNPSFFKKNPTSNIF